MAAPDITPHEGTDALLVAAIAAVDSYGVRPDPLDKGCAPVETNVIGLESPSLSLISAGVCEDANKSPGIGVENENRAVDRGVFGFNGATDENGEGAASVLEGLSASLADPTSGFLNSVSPNATDCLVDNVPAGMEPYAEQVAATAAPEVGILKLKNEGPEGATGGNVSRAGWTISKDFSSCLTVFVVLSILRLFIVLIAYIGPLFGHCTKYAAAGQLREC
jgi:hypothetical protein